MSNNLESVTIITEAVKAKNSDLSTTNENIKTSFKKIKSLKNRLLISWKGRAAEKYDAKFQVLADRYDERVVPVKEYIDRIKKAALGYEDTEDTNKTIGVSFDEKGTSKESFI